MVQCIFLVSESGEVLMEKQMAGQRVDRSICAWFWEHQNLNLNLNVMVSPTHYLFHLRRHALTFLACSQVELPPLLPLHFLSRLADILSHYLGPTPLHDDLIKDNFVIVYQILDQMIDHCGFPLTTDANLLLDLVPPPTLASKLLSAITGMPSAPQHSLPDVAASIVPWRTPTPGTGPPPTRYTSTLSNNSMPASLTMAASGAVRSMAKSSQFQPPCIS